VDGRPGRRPPAVRRSPGWQGPAGPGPGRDGASHRDSPVLSLASRRRTRAFRLTGCRRAGAAGRQASVGCCPQALPSTKG
jgi:hypothetical protein